MFSFPGCFGLFRKKSVLALMGLDGLVWFEARSRTKADDEKPRGCNLHRAVTYAKNIYKVQIKSIHHSDT